MPLQKNDIPINETVYLQELNEIWAAAWPRNLPRTPEYPKGQQPLTEYLRAWAREQSEKPALHFYGYVLSYGELDRISDAFANVLIERDVQPGDRVSVYMPNCPQFHIAFYGILKCGAVYAPVSPMAKELELRYQLQDCTPKVVVCFDQLLSQLEPVADELNIEYIFTTSLSELIIEHSVIPLPEIIKQPKLNSERGVDFFEALEHAPAGVPDYRPGLDDIAALNYTGGTTGLPKGCIHTHGDMLYTCASYLACLGKLDQDAVSLSFLPEFWIAGENGGLLFPVFGGSTLVLLARWDVVGFMAAIQHYRVNACGLVVDNVAEILEHPKVGDYDLSSLKNTGCSSYIKKLTPEYRQRWRALTGSTLVEGSYGMTETHTCDTFTTGFQDNDFDLSFGPTFVGLPVPGTEFKVCDFESGELVPLGEEGELCIRTSSLFKGYWNNPEATEMALKDGWFHTGDSGLITEQGFIRYLGRRKEMLKVKGMSVFPAELETLLGQHPAIKASAVIGRDDPVLGQKPVAFVVFHDHACETAESLSDWCREALAVYKVPEIRPIDALPLTGTGKVRKQELQSLL